MSLAYVAGCKLLATPRCQERKELDYAEVIYWVIVSTVEGSVVRSSAPW
jgi:hypothetical protein